MTLPRKGLLNCDRGANCEYVEDEPFVFFSELFYLLAKINKIQVGCRAMKTKGMVFRYTWVYSKEDTMAHTRRPVVTS